MLIKIKVIPNSKKDEIIKNEQMQKYNGSEQEVSLIVKIKAKPENNEANIAVIKLLSEYFKKKVRIVHGHKSRNKIIEIYE
jgi:uncharacterized protein (TIGR00251 family)